MLEVRVIDTPEAVDGCAEAWDELAVAAGMPFCSPAWMLAWWRHVAPEHAALRVVAVRDDGALIGIVPWFVASTRARVPELRMLCAGSVTRVEPLAAPGRVHEVAAAACAALAARRDAPGAIALEGLPVDSPWPRALAAAWPRRGAALQHDFAMPGPACDLSRGFESWLAARGGDFRREARRRTRRLAEHGAIVRRVDDHDLAEGCAELLRVYRARWDPRGGSPATAPGVEAMVRDAGEWLAGTGRFALWVLDAGGDVVGGQLFLRAGAEMVAWGGGFEPAWTTFAPTTTITLAALESAAREGVERVHLLEGNSPYKLSFADVDAALAWTTVFPRSRHYVLARTRALPKRARRAARRLVHRLPPRVQQPLRRAARRIR